MIKKSIGEAILNTLLKTKRTVTDEESSGNEQAQIDVLNHIEQAQLDKESSWSIFSVVYEPVMVTPSEKLPNADKDGKYPVDLGMLSPLPDYTTELDGVVCWSAAPTESYLRNLSEQAVQQYLTSWEFKEQEKEYCVPEIDKVTPQHNESEESAPIFPIGTKLASAKRDFVYDVSASDKSKIITSFKNMQTALDNVGNFLSSEILKDYPDYAQGKLKKDTTYTNDQGKWTEDPEPPTTKFTLTLHVYSEKQITFAVSYSYKILERTTTWGETFVEVKTVNNVYNHSVDTVVQETVKETMSLRGWYFSQVLGGITQEFYPKKAYIGLLTEMPSYSEDGKILFKEVAHKSTATADKVRTYQRMNLFRGIFSDRNVFNEVVTVTEETEKADKNYLGYAYLDNKEIIMFPEILDETNDDGEEGWGTIVAFALFENEFPTEGEEPYFCGELITPVPTEKDRVPLFRPYQFQIYLG